MADWVAFLNARLDEDEAAANAAIKDSSPRWHANGRWLFYERAFGNQFALMSETRKGSAVALAACHDPARVLREVQAKRAILAEHAASELTTYGNHACKRCRPMNGDRLRFADRTGRDCLVWPCPTVRNLAAIWDDHPDYPAAREALKEAFWTP